MMYCSTLSMMILRWWLTVSLVQMVPDEERRDSTQSLERALILRLRVLAGMCSLGRPFPTLFR